ncbi:hypothetical protein [Luteimonas sp. A649]
MTSNDGAIAAHWQVELRHSLAIDQWLHWESISIFATVRNNDREIELSTVDYFCVSRTKRHLDRGVGTKAVRAGGQQAWAKLATTEQQDEYNCSYALLDRMLRMCSHWGPNARIKPRREAVSA